MCTLKINDMDAQLILNHRDNSRPKAHKYIGSEVSRLALAFALEAYQPAKDYRQEQSEENYP